jgi:hypothetical protein
LPTLRAAHDYREAALAAEAQLVPMSAGWFRPHQIPHKVLDLPSESGRQLARAGAVIGGGAVLLALLGRGSYIVGSVAPVSRVPASP